jgi:hypothetical protein
MTYALQVSIRQIHLLRTILTVGPNESNIAPAAGDITNKKKMATAPIHAIVEGVSWDSRSLA